MKGTRRVDYKTVMKKTLENPHENGILTVIFWLFGFKRKSLFRCSS